MNRINDSNYNAYFKFQRAMNRDSIQSMNSKSEFESKNTTEKPLARKIAFQILNNSPTPSRSTKIKNWPKKNRLLNKRSFNTKQYFNHKEGSIYKPNRVKQASIDFSSKNRKIRKNPLLSKPQFYRGGERVKKYTVTKDDLKKFKVAEKFKSKKTDDERYFGLKKASRIQLISDSRKNSRKPKNSTHLLNHGKYRFSYSPQRSQKIKSFQKNKKLKNLKSFEFSKKNTSKRIIVTTRSRDSLGSAATNVWSSSSPRSLQDNRNKISINSLNNNTTQDIKNFSLHENFFSGLFKKNQQKTLDKSNLNNKIIIESSIKSVSQSQNGLRKERGKNLQLEPNLKKLGHRRIHSLQQQDFNRHGSIQSTQSYNEGRLSNRRGYVRNELNKPKRYQKFRRYSNGTEIRNFSSFNVVDYKQKNSSRNISYVNREEKSVNKIFRRIQNLTERMSKKNQVSIRSHKRTISGNNSVLSNRSIKKENVLSGRKFSKYQGYKKKTHPKNEYFITPTKLKKKRKNGQQPKNKILNYRNYFMKDWQEMRSKGKNLTESQKKDKENIEKVIRDKYGRKRLFEARKEVQSKKMFDGIMDGIKELIFVMEVNNKSGLGKS